MRHVAFAVKPLDHAVNNVVLASKLRYRDDGRADLVRPEDVKRETDQQPEGCRCIQLVLQYARSSDGRSGWLDVDAEGGLLPQAESYRRRHAETVGHWFANYEAIGGRVDYCILDFEASLDWLTVATMRADIETVLMGGEFQPLRRQLALLDCNGFKHWGGRRDQRELIWNRTLHAYVAGVLTDVFYRPVASLFPQVKLANFEHFHYSNQVRAGSHRRYTQCWTDGNGCHVGTHSGRPFYGSAAGTSTPWREARKIEQTPWNALQQGVAWGRSLALGSALTGVPWMAWVNSFHQAAAEHEAEYLLFHSPLWSEQVRHLAANGCREFVIWHRKSAQPGAKELSDVLLECDRELGDDPTADLNLAWVPSVDESKEPLVSGNRQRRRVTEYQSGTTVTGRWVDT